MFVLLFLMFLVGCLLVVPLLLVGLVLRLAIGVVLLPLRIAGFALRLTLGLVLGLVALVLAGSMLLIPLLPVIALVGAIGLLFRLTRRHPAAPLATH